MNTEYSLLVLASECKKMRIPRLHTEVSGRRYYSPSQGRFLGRDPVEEGGGLNLYGFVSNNPVNRWDFLGMWWEERSYTVDGVAYTNVGWIAGVDPEDNQFDTSADYWYASDGSGTITQAQANEMIFWGSGWTGDPRPSAYVNGVPTAAPIVDFMLSLGDVPVVAVDPFIQTNSLGAAQGTGTGVGPFPQEQPNSCVPCAIRNDLWLNGQADPGEGQICERLGSVSGRGNADFATNPTYNTGVWAPQVLASYGITGTAQNVGSMSAARLAPMLPDGSSAIIGYTMPGATVGHAVSVRSSGSDLWIYNPGGDMRTGGMTVVTLNPRTAIVITTPAEFLSGGRTISTVITTTPGPTVPIQVRLPPTRPSPPGGG